MCFFTILCINAVIQCSTITQFDFIYLKKKCKESDLQTHGIRMKLNVQSQINT